MKIPSGAEKLIDCLTHLKISYQLHEHVPVFTVEQAQAVSSAIPGAHVKNLFLANKKAPYTLMLLTVLDDKRVDLGRFSKMIGASGLTFASAELLYKLLGVIPGAVTALGLINDIENKVTFYLDREVLSFDLVNFHPLRNDFTMTLKVEDFLRFCDFINHGPEVIDVPVRPV